MTSSEKVSLVIFIVSLWALLIMAILPEDAAVWEILGMLASVLISATCFVWFRGNNND